MGFLRCVISCAPVHSLVPPGAATHEEAAGGAPQVPATGQGYHLGLAKTANIRFRQECWVFYFILFIDLY